MVITAQSGYCSPHGVLPHAPGAQFGYGFSYGGSQPGYGYRQGVPLASQAPLYGDRRAGHHSQHEPYQPAHGDAFGPVQNDNQNLPRIPEMGQSANQSHAHGSKPGIRNQRGLQLTLKGGGGDARGPWSRQEQWILDRGMTFK